MSQDFQNILDKGLEDVKSEIKCEMNRKFEDFGAEVDKKFDDFENKMEQKFVETELENQAREDRINRKFEQQMFVLETEIQRKLDIIIDKLDDSERQYREMKEENATRDRILDNHEYRILDIERKI